MQESMANIVETLTKCLNFCPNTQKSVPAGSYAVEAFKKLPQFAGLGNILDTISNFKNITGGDGTNRPMFTMDNLIDVAGKAIKNGKFDISDFMRLLPQSSVKDKPSNIEKLINNEEVVVKRIMKSNYDELIKKHEKSKQQFTDADFPPNSTSLGALEDINSSQVKWKRLSQVINACQFINQKIQPSDILQGSLGDCYFLSAIAALAQNQFRVKNLFSNLQINPYGIYMARVLYRGVLHQVVVDDYVPVDSKGRLLFAKANAGKEIWVVILEKCWAKINTSYAEIVGGLPNEVLHAFSGAPTFYRRVQNIPQKEQKLWNELIELKKKGGVICCGTKADQSIDKVGLVPGHAYTILGVFQHPQRILKIRNPWGSKQWNGKMSEKDTQFWNHLTEQQIKQFGYTSKNDGIFYMSWIDFLDYFVMIDICKVNDNAHYFNIDSKFNKKNGQIFQLQTDGGDVTLALSQKSLRSQSQAIEQQGYSRSTFVVGKQLDKGFYQYINSGSAKDFSDNYLQLNKLEKGKYIVFVKFDWIHQDQEEATISIYTESKSSLKESKQSNHINFLQQVFTNKAINSSAKKTIANNKAVYSSEFLFSKGGYGYYYLLVDKESDKSLKFQLDSGQFKNKQLVLKKPYKNGVNLQVKPGQSKFVLYRMKSRIYPATFQAPNPKISLV